MVLHRAPFALSMLWRCGVQCAGCAARTSSLASRLLIPLRDVMYILFWERHHYFTAKGKKRHLCRHFTFCGGHHQRFLRSEYIAAYILQFDLNFQVGSQNLSFSHTLCVCLYSVFNQNTSCALLLKVFSSCCSKIWTLNSHATFLQLTFTVTHFL